MASSDTSSQPQHRGIPSSIVDRLGSWLLGFPPERCSYTTQPLRIPLSDGLSRIELAADLYQPVLSNGAKVLGTILVRCPYGRGFPIALTPRAYAARGYQVLFVSSRGTFGSGGEFDAFRTEVEDGQGVVAWMREQPWYTGTFATCGGSYLGYVQWALMYDPPPDLVAAVPVVGPHDFARPNWTTGALNFDIVRWADEMARQEQTNLLVKIVKPQRKIDSVLDRTPLARNIRAHLGEGSRWLDNIVAKPDLSDPHYAPMQLGRCLDRVNIPILIVTGWYDLFLEQSMEQYARLHERGCDVALTVGPWAHMESAFRPQGNRQGFEWIEQHLSGRADAQRSSAVQYFVTGVQEWRHLPAFPPPTSPSTLYLREGGALGTEPAPPSASASCSFTFDPRDPTPSIGGNALLSNGIVNDTALARRSDVLVFDSAPLERDMEFCGRPVVSLAHSTDSPYADIFVRVSDVDAKGSSRNVTDVFRRLDVERGEDSDAVQVVLHHCSHRFLRGRRVRVIVAGGSFPHYARNHGVLNPGEMGTEMRAVVHTVRLDGVSKVVFPVVGIDDSQD
ncbi:hydrolase CocE/NonD family protein [Dothidotthia symphoricarpi CBS 119687]|uniref:Hydrolase CocE/NonD family protein n=1 Tax=Dothidotthia symphoricarpi CBS 119687 TaxID=1392245 RepID=A0A6A6A7A2_9PLEO|nr:hydrolase CocE/NonD family protein [Dothidotthia symphoricarpi CBS 119687]KAF2127902.1 hydrolase CocE/NonD family protein [Dothidotthia symphoricarpi CBS 119687]